MKFHLTRSGGRNLFTGYGEDYVSINEQRYDRHIVVTPENAVMDWEATSFEALAVQNEIDFGLHLGPDLPTTIQGDADRLNEVIGNLLSNAFKFTPRGGRISLRAVPGRPDDQVVIEVCDTGVGIPEDQLPKVFE